ncbi:hypothetical protein DFH07DRAFT_812910 [Mycena maculata]|uniref:Uncharacterized protein n=1 Tax=Mycena maculata TaxID=230809 RepID=A0AAD7NJP3_9AGAR|nr:hypothetical protein DFH07DRAFT_812910 [Mycena maculata]
MRHLSLEPEKCAMVASHPWDLRAAAGAGTRTIYIRRPAEVPVDLKPKSGRRI